MKLITNEKYIKKNKNIGMALFISTIAVLGVSAYFALTGDMTKVLYSWLGMFVGFSLTRVSMYYMNRFGREPRYDEVLADVFGKLRHEYTFFAFSSPVPYLLLGPCRLWLPILITSSGTISFENGKWKHSGVGMIKRFLGQESTVNPEREVADASNDIHKQLTKAGIPVEEQPKLQPILIVLLASTKLGDLEEAPYPVVPLPELKRFIRREDRENCEIEISKEDAEKLTKALSTVAVD